MCDNMVKEIKMSAEEAIEYVRENVQIRDILEISSYVLFFNYFLLFKIK